MALLRMRASEQEALAAGLHLFDDIAGDEGIPMNDAGAAALVAAATAALAKGHAALNPKGYSSGGSGIGGGGGGGGGGRQSPALSRASSMRIQDIALDV